MESKSNNPHLCKAYMQGENILYSKLTPSPTFIFGLTVLIATVCCSGNQIFIPSVSRNENINKVNVFERIS